MHFIRPLYWLLGLAVCPGLAPSAAGTGVPPEDAGSYAWKPFAPVVRPVPPDAGKGDGVRNPVDAFIAAGHRSRGLRPGPEAPREVLLRRVCLDLTGLPPTPAERQAFLDDASPQAYEKLVDRLLKSPGYGERWARHWMDIWRYADRDLKENGDGLQIPAHMWRWRDWIIESLNRDQGYDKMLEQMLAADEASPADREALRATAYLARNKAKSRDVWLHQTVDHCLQAFTGLTIQCARCHDHPVDAITHAEYYQLRAFFEPYQVRIDPVDGKDPKKFGLTRAFDQNLNPSTWLYKRGNLLDPDKERPMPPGVPALLKGAPPGIRPIEAGESAKASSGRRLALAKWLGARDHPLTARVAANHIWARHFGRGIVASVNDFGGSGQQPTHPALLDWLAAELMESGWKMKPLHRLIVTSAAYRRSSAPGAESIARDPDNHYLWRFAPRRLEAEGVRDALLAVSGRLDPQLGGPTLEADHPGPVFRRSLYYRSAPNTQMVFLKTFDGTVVQECYERASSVQPKQALAMLNSRLALHCARKLARELSGESGDDAARFIDQAFARVLVRAASDREREICSGYLAEVSALLETRSPGGTSNPDELDQPAAGPALRARESLVQLLFNHHEFVTLR